MNDGRLQPVFWQFGAFRQRINLLIQSVIIEKIKVNENASLRLEVQVFPWLECSLVAFSISTWTANLFYGSVTFTMLASRCIRLRS